MRKNPLRELLNRFMWDPSMDIADLEIHYLSRGSPAGYGIIRGEEIKDLGDMFIITDSLMIPYRRVLRVYYRDELVYPQE
jgi:uncharacterized protein (UPF0248 family)